MMTMMMMMMIDDMLSPYMYLPDVPAFRLLSALVCIGWQLQRSRTGLQVQCSCLRIENARERDPPCRSMPWGSHTGRRTHLPDVGVRWRLPFVSPASHVSHTITHSPTQSQSHTHTHTHTHSLTLHFDTAPTPPYTTPRRRGGEATLFWHRHRCDVPNNANGRQQRGRTRHEGACIVPHSCP